MKIKNLQSFYLLVETLEKLPSIGKKSAEKMAYTLCVENKYLGMQIAKNIQKALRTGRHIQGNIRRLVLHTR